MALIDSMSLEVSITGDTEAMPKTLCRTLMPSSMRALSVRTYILPWSQLTSASIPSLAKAEIMLSISTLSKRERTDRDLSPTSEYLTRIRSICGRKPAVG